MATTKTAKKNSKATAKKAGTKTQAPYVVVRTDRAGVHVGVLSAHQGRQVTLRDARRVWFWKGAKTLHEMSLKGVDASGSKISEPVANITLLDAIEIIPCAADGEKSLREAKWS